MNEREKLQAEINGLFTGRDLATYEAMKRAYELGLAARSRVSGSASAEDADGPIELPPPPGQPIGPGQSGQ
jgi:hypothetical protein